MTLRQLDRDLYCIDHDLRFLGVCLGTRTSVVRLADGSVALHGPGPITPEDATAIDQLGEVSALIAPNLMHHLYLGAAQTRWPHAKLFAPERLQRKQPTLRIDTALSQGIASAPLPEALSKTLEPLYVAGMPGLDEYAWLHAGSGTLILTDLAFNIRAPQPLWTRLFLHANGGWDQLGPTRVLRSAIKNRAQARAGVTALLRHDFDRVIVAHGSVQDRGGRELLQQSYRWLIEPDVADPARTPLVER
ncbi:MAG: DUF4336 domain-containing protein [Polyangiales bacterium]